MKNGRRSTIFALLLLLTPLLTARPSHADTFTDDFSDGITGSWEVRSNQPLYTVDDSVGEVRFSKPSGGTFSFQSIRLEFGCTLEGDFDVQVAFRNASINRVNGSPANQVQLNTIFGNQLFSVVRDDDVVAGENAHVYVDPPRQWRGPRATPATSGTLRIRRVGTTVSGFFNGTLLHSGTFNADPVSRLWVSLQNNGTKDATSVVFDDFQVTADAITACDGTVLAEGTVSSDCHGPLAGVPVDILSGGEFVTTITDEGGNYFLPSVPFSLDAGEVTIAVPLGYSPLDPATGQTAVVFDANRVTDFTLACVEASGEARGKGYWKHQANVHLAGRGHAHESYEDMSAAYPSAIFSHFFENGLNAVQVEGVTYQDDGSGPAPLDLATIGETLGVRGGSQLERAKEEFLALLLNVASGKILTHDTVSADGATASQALQYVADLINNDDTSDDAPARDVAASMNDAVLLAAGVIPSGTYGDIAYSALRDRRPELAVHPNPGGAGPYSIDFDVPRAGDVRISIVDVAGRMVATPMVGRRDAGTGRARWDGRSGDGPVPTGVYFVRLETDTGTVSRKVVHLGR